jgi:hypothetical protein
MKNNKKKSNTVTESINLGIIDQRVLAVRNYMSILQQNGMSRFEAERKAEAECFDAYIHHQLYEVNGFKYAQQ